VKSTKPNSSNFNFDFDSSNCVVNIKTGKKNSAFLCKFSCSLVECIPLDYQFDLKSILISAFFSTDE